MVLEQLYEIDPYSLNHDEKEKVLLEGLTELTKLHQEKCPEYAKIINIQSKKAWETTSDIPFIPVRLFKNYELLSTDRSEIVKTMTSSGTSGQAVSKIFLDRDNTKNQTKTLASIITSYIGKKRLPLLLLDTEMVKNDRSMFSARGAGIIGFSTFGRNITYALDADMKLDIEKVKAFCEAHSNETVLMFGYTYMIWQFIVRELETSGIQIPFKEAILLNDGK